MHALRALAVSAALLVPACGGGQPEEALPLQAPDAAPSLDRGTATVRLRGDLRERFEVPLDVEAPNIFQPPDGGFALSWAGDEPQGLGIGGHLFTGTRETGDGLSVAVTTAAETTPVVFSSFEGECEVTLTTVRHRALEGDFECLGLAARGMRVDARGTFEASG